MKAFSCGLRRSIRPRHARVSSTGETFFALMRADARSMLRNASASDGGADCCPTLEADTSFALVSGPIIAPATAASDASRNVLRVKTAPPPGAVITADTLPTDPRELVIGM